MEHIIIWNIEIGMSAEERCKGKLLWKLSDPRQQTSGVDAFMSSWSNDITADGGVQMYADDRLLVPTIDKSDR